LDPKEEFLTKSGYSLDALVVVNGEKIGVEVDGPSHFVGTNGRTLLGLGPNAETRVFASCSGYDSMKWRKEQSRLLKSIIGFILSLFVVALSSTLCYQYVHYKLSLVKVVVVRTSTVHCLRKLAAQ
jgi:hypothetical protein